MCAGGRGTIIGMSPLSAIALALMLWAPDSDAQPQRRR